MSEEKRDNIRVVLRDGISHIEFTSPSESWLNMILRAKADGALWTDNFAVPWDAIGLILRNPSPIQNPLNEQRQAMQAPFPAFNWQKNEPV